MDKNKKELVCNINPNLDEVVDEKGNQSINLRLVAWGENGKEKLEIRKWFIHDDGSETASKGVAFFTEDGPHNLVHAMIKNDYGKTDVILNNLKSRKDFNSSLVSILGKSRVDEIKDTEVEYWDPREIKG